MEEKTTGSRRPSMRDVTGDEDETHFGPGRADRPASRSPQQQEDEDSYNPPRKPRNEDPVDEKSNREGRREGRDKPRDVDPSEADIQRGKDNYSEDDFKGEVVSGGEGVIVPEDVYEVRCVDVIPTMMKDKFKNNIEVPKVRMVFEIINDPDFEGVKISRILNRNFAVKSNLVEWYTKITGEQTEKGNSIDIRKCKGKECRVSVTLKKNDDGEKKNKITEILARKRKPA